MAVVSVERVEGDIEVNVRRRKQRLEVFGDRPFGGRQAPHRSMPSLPRFGHRELVKTGWEATEHTF